MHQLERRDGQHHRARQDAGLRHQTRGDFFEKAIQGKAATSEQRYRNALFHLLSAETSCYRYWGEGIWTEYGRELCRRTDAILDHDF